MANTKPIGVAYEDQNIVGADTVDATTVSGTDINGVDIYASDELGYAPSAQGAVTQLTSKSTAVTLNTSAGRITMNNAALNATTNVTFTLNNSKISLNDVVVLSVSENATAGAYNCWISGKAVGSASITVRNISASSLSEAVVINFAIIHCV
jgi:hypothetical protein